MYRDDQTLTSGREGGEAKRCLLHQAEHMSLATVAPPINVVAQGVIRCSAALQLVVLYQYTWKTQSLMKITSGLIVLLTITYEPKMLLQSI